MQLPIIAAAIASGLAAPALAATGVMPDASSFAMLIAGISMIGLAAGGRRRQSSRMMD